MGDVTPNYSLPFPTGDDPACGAEQIQALAEAIDGGAVVTGLIAVERFATDGTFDPSAYPTIRAVEVWALGAGGGGGGCIATSDNQGAAAGGGGGGSCGYAFIPMTATDPPVAVTIGANGAAGTSSTNGGTGGTTTFGALVSGIGGGGGVSQTDGPGVNRHQSGGLSGGPGAGAFTIRGGDGSNGMTNSQGVTGAFPVAVGIGGAGGGPYGTGNRRPSSAASSGNGQNASGPGAGGSGAFNRANSGAVTGGFGGAGLCVVKVYA